MKPKIIIIQGQTASGKSALALSIAESFSGEIVNADSMQVYKYMDIGTSKMSIEERQGIPHHLLDVIEPDEDYNASKFAKHAHEKIHEIIRRGNVPIIVGGTGLYIRCLLGGLFDFEKDTGNIRKGLEKELSKEGVQGMHARLARIDPKAAEKIRPSDKQRILRALEIYHASGERISDLQERHKFKDRTYNYLKIGLKIDKERLFQRIKERTLGMFEKGLLSEVETLLEKGYKSGSKALNSIGYREAVAYVKGSLDKEKVKEAVIKRTKDYAKRQLTWFKKDKEIKWFDPDSERGFIFESVKEFLNS